MRPIAFAVLAAVVAGCGGDASPPPPAPATIEHPREEAELTTVTLTPDAVERLGITLAPVDRRRVPRRRTFAGEVVLPVRGPDGRVLPAGVPSGPADRMRTFDALITADADLRRAKAEVVAAERAAVRAEEVLRAGSGTARAVEEAHARRDAGRAAADAAERRYALLAGAAGADPMAARWVRVAVPVGDLPGVDADAPAEVTALAARPQAPRLVARPVPAVRVANPDAATVDVVYAIEGDARTLAVGERVGVVLRLRDEGEMPVVPWAAVVTDVHGGEWVYEAAGAGRFTRRRVAVAFVADGMAVLARGPEAGGSVVVAGAAELFGAEFGVGE